MYIFFKNQVNLPKRPKTSKPKSKSFFEAWAMPIQHLQQPQQLPIQSIVIPVKIKEIGKKYACKKYNQFSGCIQLHRVIHPKLDLVNVVVRPLLFTKLSLFIKSSIYYFTKSSLGCTYFLQNGFLKKNNLTTSIKIEAQDQEKNET